MANLKEIRTRIASVITTRQITSAMKMVSAAKLRKAQDAIIQMRPYANKLQQILSNLASNIQSDEVEMFKEDREIKRGLFIVITSNKGLCGGFNANIVKQVISELNNEYKLLLLSGNADIMCLGKKGAELLKAKNIKVDVMNSEMVENISYDQVIPLAVDVVEQFLNHEYDVVKLYYNQFKNAGTQIVISEQYLPVPVEEDLDNPIHHDYILEPSQHEIVEELIPKTLKIQFFKAILDSAASEHGARMTAMHKATDNASDLIKSLQLEYNKARQSAITTEILEIVGGAEALKS